MIDTIAYCTGNKLQKTDMTPMPCKKVAMQNLYELPSLHKKGQNIRSVNHYYMMNYNEEKLTKPIYPKTPSTFKF